MNIKKICPKCNTAMNIVSKDSQCIIYECPGCKGILSKQRFEFVEWLRNLIWKD
jgi:Zn-finger nucleic acid-binding protein